MSIANAPNTSSAAPAGATGADAGASTTATQSATASGAATSTTQSTAAQAAAAGAAADSAGAAAADAAKVDAKPNDKAKADDKNADVEALKARLAALEADNARVHAQNKRAQKAAFLQGIVRPELLDLTPDVQLTADGALTADSRTKLEAWKAERPEYFGRPADASARNTPAAASTLTADESARLKAAGIDVGTGRRGTNFAAISAGLRGGLS